MKKAEAQEVQTTWNRIQRWLSEIRFINEVKFQFVVVTMRQPGHVEQDFDSIRLKNLFIFFLNNVWQLRILSSPAFFPSPLIAALKYFFLIQNFLNFKFIQCCGKSIFLFGC